MFLECDPNTLSYISNYDRTERWTPDLNYTLSFERIKPEKKQIGENGKINLIVLVEYAEYVNLNVHTKCIYA